MKVNRSGCALCDATWGKHYANIDGETMFFCCSVCATAFSHMVDEVKKLRGWIRIDELHLEGDNRTGRRCTAYTNGERCDFTIKFYGDGRIMEFTHG